ncbi:MAG: hypothetical protein KGH71_05775, partial [Candidatus Micrarchaeota archaeon]|nr:hypothetical protein [Candidatus Micrarchaeota archaeon]
MFPFLPLMVILPFLAVIPIALLSERHSHKIALIAAAGEMVLACRILYDVSQGGLPSLSFAANYLTNLGINLSFQVTSLSLILVLMTAIVFLAAAIVGKEFIQKDQKLYSIIFMLVEGGALGLFLSGNLFLFYIFWEIAEFAMFFIIFAYGGYDRRYAAIKFIIYSIIASLLLLIGIMMLYFYSTPHSFDIYQLQQSAATLPMAVQPIILVLLLVAFMI